MTARAIVLAALLTAVAAPSALSAPVEDRTVGESPGVYGVAVGPTAVAWSTDDGHTATVHLRVGTGPVRDLLAGPDSDSVSIGRDDRGREVLAYARCVRSTRCTIRLVDVATGRGRTVAGIPPARISLPAVAARTLVWVDGDKRVLVRSLRGGQATVQASGRRGLSFDGLSFDGARLALTGDPGDATGASGVASELRTVDLGSRRVRSLVRHDCGEEVCESVQNPVLAPGEILALEPDFESGAGSDATSLVSRFPLARRRPSAVWIGAGATFFARSGRRFAYVTPGRCVAGTLATGCARVVLAGTNPLAADRAERLLPVALSLDRATGRTVTGRVARLLLARGRRGVARGVAGVAVSIREVEDLDADLRFAGAAPIATTTGPDGRFSVTVPPATRTRRFVAIAPDGPGTIVSDPRGVSAAAR